MVATDHCAILLQVADVLSTRAFLAAGRTHEANPLVAWMMRRMGAAWQPAKVIAASAGAALLWWHGYAALLWGLDAAMAVIVIRNWRIAKQGA